MIPYSSFSPQHKQENNIVTMKSSDSEVTFADKAFQLTKYQPLFTSVRTGIHINTRLIFIFSQGIRYYSPNPIIALAKLTKFATPKLPIINNKNEKNKTKPKRHDGNFEISGSLSFMVTDE